MFLLFLFFSGFIEAAPHPDLHEKIRDAALRSSLDPLLVQAVVEVESGYKRRATSKKGAMGLMQVMPDTADHCDIQDPYNTVNNLMGACECLRRLINRFQGNVRLALAAYNAGPHNVQKYQGIPPFPETISYVKKVLGIYSKLKTAKRHGRNESLRN